jgi:hypothetical protein
VGAVMVAVMVALQDRNRSIPGQLWAGEGCVDEPGLEIRGAHQGQRVGDASHGLTQPELETKRGMVRWQC